MNLGLLRPTIVPREYIDSNSEDIELIRYWSIGFFSVTVVNKSNGTVPLASLVLAPLLILWSNFVRYEETVLSNSVFIRE